MESHRAQPDRAPPTICKLCTRSAGCRPKSWVEIEIEERRGRGFILTMMMSRGLADEDVEAKGMAGGREVED